MTSDLSNPRKLKWACRRGMLELDVILERYLSNHYEHADAKTQQQFQALLLCQDQDLYRWLIKHEPAPPEYEKIVKILRDHKEE